VPGSFRLAIVTPEQLIWEGEVSALQAPGLDGSFGVLHNRAPLIAALGPGLIRYSELDGPTRILAVSGGFFQVAGNKAIVLADEAAYGEDIDRTAAEAELLEVNRKLMQRVDGEREREELQQRRAVAQAKVAAASAQRR
jgi:F-type H+-transporting ATPase subunit epsilon